MFVCVVTYTCTLRITSATTFVTTATAAITAAAVATATTSVRFGSIPQILFKSHRQAGDADAACCSSHREPAKPITWQSGWSNGAEPQPKQSGPDTPGTAGAPSSSLSPAPCHLEQQCGASASRWSSSLCLSLRSSPGPSLCFWPCPLLCPLLCPSPAVPARMKVAHRRWRSKNPMSPAMPA